MQPTSADVVVVGAGILGLATARELLLRSPGARVVVIEKEERTGAHQTGHNSGVIHAGIYYKPGSLKARFCVEGSRLMIAYCERHDIPWERCGKVIVAGTPEEERRLQGLHARGVENGVEGLELVGPARLAELQPGVFGLGAIWSPATAITDYKRVAACLTDEVRELGGTIVLGAPATSFTLRSGGRRLVETPLGVTAAGYVVTCCGLQSDRTAQLSGAPRNPRIVPFRGSYHHLTAGSSARFTRLVYPVPDPAFPFFLGVHFTRQLDGIVWAGPTAVLAFAREGYGRADVNLAELWDAIGYAGFRSLMRTSWRLALAETRLEFRKSEFVAELRRMAPWIGPADLQGGHSGVRAQALGEDGTLVEDFWLDRAEGITHVRNAPSPAATSSLAIAVAIADEASHALGRS